MYNTCNIICVQYIESEARAGDLGISYAANDMYSTHLENGGKLSKFVCLFLEGFGYIE